MNYFKHDKAIVDDGATIGEGTRVWAFAHVQKGAQIGSGCNVGHGAYIEKGSVVGNHVTVKNNVSIFDGVTIEDDVFIGANIAFINDRFPRSHREDQWTLEKTLVRKGATLGAGAVIMCGVTIGQYALIGAGSVVTKNVPDHAIVVGNPAKFKGYACHCGRPLNQYYRCSCGRTYTVHQEGLVLLGK